MESSSSIRERVRERKENYGIETRIEDLLREVEDACIAEKGYISRKDMKRIRETFMELYLPHRFLEEIKNELKKLKEEDPSTRLRAVREKLLELTDSEEEADIYTERAIPFILSSLFS